MLSAMLLVLAGACAAPLALGHRLPQGPIVVRGDIILHDGQPFAELHCVAPKRGAPHRQCRGVALHFFEGDRVAWIFRAKGLYGTSLRANYGGAGQYDGYFGWACDLSISDDGRFVTYTQPGMLWANSYVYAIEEGTTETL